MKITTKVAFLSISILKFSIIGNGYCVKIRGGNVMCVCLYQKNVCKETEPKTCTVGT